MYIEQLKRFVRVSIFSIYCLWQRVQNDGEAAFCGIGWCSIHVGLEPVLYISEGKTNTNSMYHTCCATIDTPLLKYLMKEVGIDRKCHIPTSPVDNNDNLLLYLSERIAETIGIDRQFPVPIRVYLWTYCEGISPLGYWQEVNQSPTQTKPYNTLSPFEYRDSWSSYGAVRAYSGVLL